jgi:hypothetical protein
MTIVFSAEKQSQMGKLRATKILLRLHKQFHSFFFSLSLALFFFSFSFLFARELLVPKGLDTTTIMELTKWSLILVVVMVVFLSNVAKFGHHHLVPHCHQTKKHTENLVAKSMHAQPHTHTQSDRQL